MTETVQTQDKPHPCPPPPPPRVDPESELQKLREREAKDKVLVTGLQTDLKEVGVAIADLGKNRDEIKKACDSYRAANPRSKVEQAHCDADKKLLCLAKKVQESLGKSRAHELYKLFEKFAKDVADKADDLETAKIELKVARSQKREADEYLAAEKGTFQNMLATEANSKAPLTELEKLHKGMYDAMTKNDAVEAYLHCKEILRRHQGLLDAYPEPDYFCVDLINQWGVVYEAQQGVWEQNKACREAEAKVEELTVLLDGKPSGWRTDPLGEVRRRWKKHLATPVPPPEGEAPANGGSSSDTGRRPDDQSHQDDAQARDREQRREALREERRAAETRKRELEGEYHATDDEERKAAIEREIRDLDQRMRQIDEEGADQDTRGRQDRGAETEEGGGDTT
ncbi:hypothetical protein LX15_000870 [Streptoalloteichus tenebrarius]|uniref:Uncharacterized protein n=1 Tax=Streptoalloteichus tenebrarius (strain ATCC 17920 / DSM 40477 / JCM 4838 / CBS 697.72 / NBRC 16177 / NCIMB 11028 / NRRL B-12390 / A12253. 1 / ISP 5477) TaxID=1933 RepID=A0ABT1HNU7_STRSD|nr:hypothetical protein [Streptoalloteichus tenebrarius]MCP2257185.1 hypothetical protein [Streptoalloteichus tenebrarius]BFE98819.1 hypothetical protein GCM10020241_04950 [Streptoalloteichus tenebrarius]